MQKPEMVVQMVLRTIITSLKIIPLTIIFHVITVAAIASMGNLSSFSNYGFTSVDLGAPGQGIWFTTAFNSYESYSGTSMATPHVGGAAPLYKAKNSGATAAQVNKTIFAAARSIPTPSLAGKTATGGRLNASGF